MVEHYANTEEFIYICMWVCFAKGVGEGGFLCVCFCSDFLGLWKWGGGRLGGIRVCLFVLVLMQLLSTNDRIDSYFSQLGFV